jgi:hypothetical protein
MGHLLGEGGRARQCPGGALEGGPHAALFGLQTPALGIGEPLGGKSEVGELFEGAADACEALRQMCGHRTHKRGARRRTQQRQRRTEQGRALLVVRAVAPGAHQGQGLARGEPESLDGVRQVLLGLRAERGQGIGHARPHAALVHPSGHRRREALGQEQPLVHPGDTTAQEPRDGRRAHAVVVPQRVHHPRLVHGGHRPPRGVGPKQRPLDLVGVACLLDDRGHQLGPRRSPAGQALEAVEDLETALGRRHHPQGQRGQTRVVAGRERATA